MTEMVPPSAPEPPKKKDTTGLEFMEGISVRLLIHFFFFLLLSSSSSSSSSSSFSSSIFQSRSSRPLNDLLSSSYD